MLSRYNFIIVVLLTFVCFYFRADCLLLLTGIQQSCMPEEFLISYSESKKATSWTILLQCFQMRGCSNVFARKTVDVKTQVGTEANWFSEKCLFFRKILFGFFTAIALLIMGLKFNWYDWQISYGIPILSELVST